MSIEVLKYEVGSLVKHRKHYLSSDYGLGVIIDIIKVHSPTGFLIRTNYLVHWSKSSERFWYSHKHNEIVPCNLILLS